MLASPAAAIGRADGFNFLIEWKCKWRWNESLGSARPRGRKADAPGKEIIERFEIFERQRHFFQIQLEIRDKLGAVGGGAEWGGRGGVSVSRRELFEATQQPRAHFRSGFRLRKRLAVAVRHVLQQSFDGRQ